jgi:Nucleotide-diphospho-sugar transferase
MLEKGLTLFMVVMRGSLRSLKEFIVYLDNYIRGRYWYVVGSFILRSPIWPKLYVKSSSEANEGGKEGRKIFVMMHCGQLTELYDHCLKSAKLYCPDSLIEFFTDLSTEERAVLQKYGINFHDINAKDFAQKSIALKIDLLKYLDLRHGDRVIVSDLDILFQGDPFSVFENDFDVFFTTRHYDYHYPINGGIWGFRVNERSRRFIVYYIRQMYTKSWNQLRKFKKRFHRLPYGFGWFDDQDFLCTVYENLKTLPEEISNVRFYDAGYRFNYCPSYDTDGQAAVQDLKSKLGNKDFVVLHLKGELKQLICTAEL